ncbi:MAG: DUF2975 domain-containing protein [Desulfovibrio sp.]|uniref:DUF2975 domain-containing protein n=1 Tax=Desulfovibrio sp. 7SRBS1 TaxID=3378064 RepID=UPI003B401C2D
MAKIRSVSRMFRFLFLAAMLLPIFSVCSWLWLGPENGSVILQISPLSHGLEEFIPSQGLDMQQRLLGMAAQAVPAAVNMFLYWQLAVLFGLYSKGEIFTSGNVACYRRTAFALLASQVLGPLYQAAASLVLTMNNGPGHRTIAVGLDNYDLAEVLIAVVIIVIAWVMDEGRKLKDEEALVI